MERESDKADGLNATVQVEVDPALQTRRDTPDSLLLTTQFCHKTLDEYRGDMEPTAASSPVDTSHQRISLRLTGSARVWLSKHSVVAMWKLWREARVTAERISVNGLPVLQSKEDIFGQRHDTNILV